MDVFGMIGSCMYELFYMLSDVTFDFLGDVSLLTLMLFFIVVGYLIDFLLNAFGNKKGGVD